MEKQKLMEITSAYAENDIVKVKALDTNNQEVYISLPTLEYLNRRDSEFKRVFNADMSCLDAPDKDIESCAYAIWDIARDICSMGPNALQEAFGFYAPRFVFKNYSPYQAAGILLEYREKKRRKEGQFKC